MQKNLVFILAFFVLMSVGFCPMSASGIMVNIPVSADVSLSSSEPDENHGAAVHPYLWVGDNNGTRDYETMFGFQIPELVAPGEELILNSASFNTFCNYASYGGVVQIAEGNTDDWDPLLVTWNNSHDDFGPELDSVLLNTYDAFTWVSWNIIDSGATTFLDGFFTVYLYTDPAPGYNWHDFENLEYSGSNNAYLTLDYEIENAVIPEPSTTFLMGFGFLGLLGVVRRRRKK